MNKLIALTTAALFAAACNTTDTDVDGDALAASIDGKPLVFSSVTATATSIPGATRLTLVGRADPDPKMADDEYSLSITVEIAPSASGVAGTYSIDGTTTFAGPPEGTWSGSLSETDVSFQPAGGTTPGIIRAWVMYGCGCYRYQADKQALAGALVLTSGSAGHLTGTLHVDLDGQIPFWSGGFGAHATATIEAAFDLDVSAKAQ